MNFFTRKCQCFWSQVQNSYSVENLWMAFSVSVIFLLIFRNSYILEHVSVTVLVYSCVRIFRPFCIFFSICLSIKMSILYIIDLNTFENFKDKINLERIFQLSQIRIHKNQVELMKLKGFSLLWVEIKQYLFMKSLT